MSAVTVKHSLNKGSMSQYEVNIEIDQKNLVETMNQLSGEKTHCKR